MSNSGGGGGDGTSRDGSSLEGSDITLVSTTNSTESQQQLPLALPQITITNVERFRTPGGSYATTRTPTRTTVAGAGGRIATADENPRPSLVARFSSAARKSTIGKKSMRLSTALRKSIATHREIRQSLFLRRHDQETQTSLVVNNTNNEFGKKGTLGGPPHTSPTNSSGNSSSGASSSFFQQHQQQEQPIVVGGGRQRQQQPRQGINANNINHNNVVFDGLSTFSTTAVSCTRRKTTATTTAILKKRGLSLPTRPGNIMVRTTGEEAIRSQLQEKAAGSSSSSARNLTYSSSSSSRNIIMGGKDVDASTTTARNNNDNDESTTLTTTTTTTTTTETVLGGDAHPHFSFWAVTLGFAGVSWLLCIAFANLATIVDLISALFGVFQIFTYPALAFLLMLVAAMRAMRNNNNYTQERRNISLARTSTSGFADPAASASASRTFFGGRVRTSISSMAHTLGIQRQSSSSGAMTTTNQNEQVLGEDSIAGIANGDHTSNNLNNSNLVTIPTSKCGYYFHFSIGVSLLIFGAFITITVVYSKL